MLLHPAASLFSDFEMMWDRDWLLHIHSVWITSFLLWSGWILTPGAIRSCSRVELLKNQCVVLGFVLLYLRGRVISWCVCVCFSLPVFFSSRSHRRLDHMMLSAGSGEASPLLRTAKTLRSSRSERCQQWFRVPGRHSCACSFLLCSLEPSVAAQTLSGRWLISGTSHPRWSSWWRQHGLIFILLCAIFFLLLLPFPWKLRFPWLNWKVSLSSDWFCLSTDLTPSPVSTLFPATAFPASESTYWF